MDENLEMLIKDDKVDKLCGNNMVGIIKTVTSMKSNFGIFFKNQGNSDCHVIIMIWPKPILKLILENLILLIDGCINTNEVILLYEKNVDIDELLKSRGD